MKKIGHYILSGFPVSVLVIAELYQTDCSKQ